MPTPIGGPAMWLQPCLTAATETARFARTDPHCTVQTAPPPSACRPCGEIAQPGSASSRGRSVMGNGGSGLAAALDVGSAFGAGGGVGPRQGPGSKAALL